MEYLDYLFDRAQVSTSRVSVVAAELGVKRRSITLGTLAGELSIVSRALDRPTSDQQELFRGRIEKLLADLENVCTWPTPAPRGTYATLLDIASDPTKRPYQRAVVAIRRGLVAYASAVPRIRESFHLNLKKFTNSKHNGVEEVTEIPEQSLEGALEALKLPTDYARHVNEYLYAALRKHSACTCTSSGTTENSIKQHEARLRLKGSHTVCDGFVLFDVLFSGSPGPFTVADGCFWQHLRLHVPSKRQGLKKVRIKQDEATQLLSEPSTIDERVEPVDGGAFCNILKGKYGKVRICLKIHDGDLHRLHDADGIDHYVEAVQSVSLAQVLETYILTTKMKVVLAYILARSVWQYYNSDLMKTRWTGESIHFLVEQDTTSDMVDQQSKLYACRPCFAVRFNDNDDTLSEYCDSFSIIHRYPRVLALGNLLLDIGHGFCSAQARSQSRSTEEKINNDFTTAQMVFKDGRWPYFEYMPNQRFKQIYKTAVMNCFNKQVFGASALQSRANTSGSDGEIEGRRAVLYERVVHPLETLLANLGWENALGNIEPMNLKIPSQANTEISNGEPAGTLSSPLATGGAAAPDRSEIPILPADSAQSIPLEPERTLDKITKFPVKPQILAQCTNSKSSDASAKEANEADIYMKTLIKTRQLLLGGTKSKTYEPVRIAILDSGINSNHPIDEYIEDYEDFVSGEKVHLDLTGHGTNGVSVTLKIVPDALVHVARVFEEEPTSSATPLRVAAAIRHARKVWKVNVIAMSFGFKEDYKDISEEIYKAQAKGILTFAAVGNQGNREDIAFPAKLEGVLGVFSTNSWVKASVSFNPEPTSSTTNIGFLGEQVEVTLFNGMHSRASGTSISTSIAAATAALLIDLSQWQDCCGLSNISKLKTVEGMSAVLKSMAKKDGKLYCFNPWSDVFSPSHREAPSDAAKRLEICKRINGSL